MTEKYDDIPGRDEDPSADSPRARLARIALVLAAVSILAGGIYFQQKQIGQMRNDIDRPGQARPAPLTPPPADAYPWIDPARYEPAYCIAARIAPPRGFRRARVEPDSFAQWLRCLPLLPGEPPVLKHDGTPRKNQNAHFAVLDLPVGPDDSLRSADGMYLLRTTWLFVTGQAERMRFGPGPIDFSETLARIASQPTTSASTAPASPGPLRALKAYQKSLFAVADSSALIDDTLPIPLEDLRIGDLFVHPARPGHAAIVVDLAIHPSTGNKVFLLAQGGSPAQQLHVIINPTHSPFSPWYPLEAVPQIHTPDWTFSHDELRRFH